MIEPIKKISAVKIIKETCTKGNSPLLVRCDDSKNYYAKTSTSRVPRIELINEIICSYFLKLWGLNVPNIALIKIDKIVVDSYISEVGSLSKKYNSFSFDDYFVGFEEITPATELEKYIQILSSKHEWKKFNLFDAWVCNKDRKPDNPNILISGNSNFDFVPIDNAASFGYCTSYKSLNKSMMHLEEKKSILSIPILRSITKFVLKKELETLNQDVLLSISECLNRMDEIFNQVPSSWGFSKKERQKLKDILGDNDRNVVTSEKYFPYIKKK